MKCRYCRKNVHSISHFMKAHKALMLRKSRAGRSKARRSSPSTASRRARSSKGDAWVKKGKKRYTLPGTGVTIIIGGRA